MKRYLLMTMTGVCLFVSFAQAQLQKGNVLVGGDISQFNLTLNSSKAFTIDIDPKAAWFIQDNLAIGGYVNFQLATAKGAGTATQYGLGGLGRYYFSRSQVDVARSVHFFAEANAGIEGTNAANGGASTNGLGLGVGPGLAYFFSPMVSLEALLKFNGIVGFGSDASTNYLTLGLGFQIYLPNKKVKQIMKGKM